MIVTRVEPLTKTKFRIYIDEHPAFVLYQGEVKRYHLAESREITEDIYQKIRSEIVLKHAFTDRYGENGGATPYEA